MHRLITIRFSHYAERARWALDRARIAYREEPHLPLLHFPAVVLATRGRAGRADKASSPYSTPVLITDDGRALRDSGDIVRYAAEQSGEDLHPVPEVAEVEQRLHDRLGPHGRRVTYYFLFDNPDLLPPLARRNVGRAEAALFNAMLPITRRFLVRRLGIDRESAERSMQIARAEFAYVEELLGDRDYLVGDRFTAADLTFAALSAAVLLPGAGEGYGANLPTRDEMPAGPRALCDELRATRAGRHALRMYAEERVSPVLACAPPLDRTRRYQ